MTLIQAAAELADLYDLDLVPWADKVENPIYVWTLETDEEGEPTGKYLETFKEMAYGHKRAPGERVKSIRSLHKTYLDRLDAMRQKGINAQLSDSTYEWAYGKKRRRRKK
jgi:hypothetical protein